MPDHGHHKGTLLTAKQAAQRTARAVVAEGFELPTCETEQVGHVGGGPLADAVQGLARDEHVSHQHQEGTDFCVAPVYLKEVSRIQAS